MIIECPHCGITAEAKVGGLIEVTHVLTNKLEPDKITIKTSEFECHQCNYRWSDNLPPKGRNQEKKADAGKLMMELIPPSALTSLARVLTYGAEKYSARSWQTIDSPIDRYTGALFRHFTEFLKYPYAVDPESGLLHIEHVLVNAAFLNDFIAKEYTNG